jgi:NAD(P)H-flavin reductase
MLPLPVSADVIRVVPRAFRVRRKRRDSRDTVTLELDPIEGLPLSFTAGQFNMVYVMGVGEVPISISGSPLDPAPLVHTVRGVGPVSQAICEISRGATIGVRGPYGVGWPMVETVGKDIVLIAGGIGLAPLRPAMQQILAQRERYGRVALLAGARTPQDLLYVAELQKWRARFDVEVLVTVDSAAGGWAGHVGVVTKLIGLARFESDETVAMLCGPEVMMRFCVTELLQRGLRSEDIYLSMERNMKCAVGFCGHCQFGPTFVCKDGPVFQYARLEPFLKIREV